MPKTLISSVFFVLSAIAAVLLAQERRELTKPELSVSVRNAEPSYSIKKNICLEIQLENVRKEPQLLFRSWGSYRIIGMLSALPLALAFRRPTPGQLQATDSSE
jgi:hypothetical protein